MSACSDCAKRGTFWEGETTGKETSYKGTNVYVASPSSASNKGILIIPDIFGWDAKNNRLLADKYAAKGFLTILPDFFADDAVPLEALQAKDMPTFLSWIERNGPSVVNPKTEKFIEYLKEQKVTSIGIVGYCWGGRFGALLTHIDQVKALVINHGSFMTEEHVKSIRIPSLWNCADNDSHIKKDTIEKYKEILKKNDAPGDFKYYDGANHGWTARGDDKDPELAPKISDAFDRGIEFFNKYL